MNWLTTPDNMNQAFEMVCCFFTIIAVFTSYFLSFRG
jgi:hypothetical protein